MTAAGGFEPVWLVCTDGFRLAGQFWPARGGSARRGAAIVNPATGVLARYYHRYARFLADEGFDVLTYDYRGIGLSRPERLRGSGIRWRDWGMLDFDAAVGWMRDRAGGPLVVVGHSIGGFLPGYAPRAPSIDRMLTMGAQYAYWPDYAPRRRLALLAKWHVVMPVLTAVRGYFPGKRLGWLEDLPAGVANEWSFRGARFEASHQRAERRAILARFAAVRAPILAVGLTDDEFGTVPAIRRGLSYYTGAERVQVELPPQAFGQTAIGHFGLFHDRHRETFWRASLLWLVEGVNPWADAAVR